MPSPVQNKTPQIVLQTALQFPSWKRTATKQAHISKPNWNSSLLFFNDCFMLHESLKTKSESSNKVLLRRSWALFTKAQLCLFQVRLTWFMVWLDFYSIIADVFFGSQIPTGSKATVKLSFHFALVLKLRLVPPKSLWMTSPPLSDRASL